MDLQKVANSRQAMILALGIARAVPPRVGYAIGDIVSGWIASRRATPMVRAIRLNQWVASDMSLTSEQLDARVHEVLRHAACTIYDLYHQIRNKANIIKNVEYTPKTIDFVNNTKDGVNGGMVAGLHMSNFDLGFCSLALNGLKMQVLSYANPGGGYQYQNQIREEMGLEMTPIDAIALRKASTRLTTGGLVVTGVERPDPNLKHMYNFFGYPARLPDGHVRLALRADVPLFPIHVRMQKNGKYLIDVDGPYPLLHHPDREQEITINVEKILATFETWIRQTPQQWLMYYPVWPQLMDQMP